MKWDSHTDIKSALKALENFLKKYQNNTVLNVEYGQMVGLFSFDTEHCRGVPTSINTKAEFFQTIEDLLQKAEDALKEGKVAQVSPVLKNKEPQILPKPAINFSSMPFGYWGLAVRMERDLYTKIK